MVRLKRITILVRIVNQVNTVDALTTLLNMELLLRRYNYV